MKKSMLFSIILGIMTSLIASFFGFKINDWEWWAIIIIPAIVLNILYHSLTK